MALEYRNHATYNRVTFTIISKQSIASTGANTPASARLALSDTHFVKCSISSISVIYIQQLYVLVLLSKPDKTNSPQDQDMRDHSSGNESIYDLTTNKVDMQQFTLGDLNCNYNAQMYPRAANTPSPYLVPPTISHTFFADRSLSTIQGQNLWANDLWAENSYPSSQHSVSLSLAEPPLITTLPQPHMTLPWPNATSSSVQPIAIPSTLACNPVSKIRPIEQAIAN
jgi:hypothetical protein